MNETFYGTVSEANTYFSYRLHETAWTAASNGDRAKALLAATQIVDALNYKGWKHSVWTLYQAYTWPSHPTATLVRAANQEQALEFPRDADTSVPEPIRQAVYEIAYNLLDGRDPELELEAIAVNHQAYGSVQTTYNRNQVPLEHIINGVPSIVAWRLLRSFLRPGDEVKLSRIS